MQIPIATPTTDRDLADLSRLQAESLSLIAENADPEGEICGNEWLIVQYLREAEEAGAPGPLLRALKECACGQIARMAAGLEAA